MHAQARRYGLALIEMSDHVDSMLRIGVHAKEVFALLVDQVSQLTLTPTLTLTLTLTLDNA